MIDHFRLRYSLEAVTLLGGEPLLYRDIETVAQHAKSSGLRVEICTNGHPGFQERLRRVAPYLDKLRVSLDGLRRNHDFMRQRGSFDGAMQMIELARELGTPTAATMTVTDANLRDVVPLAKELERRGVTEIKLHCVRIVGNAVSHAGVKVPDRADLVGLHDAIAAAGLRLDVLYDSDLSPTLEGPVTPQLRQGGKVERIESDPRGGLTFSCKASGHHLGSFRWDKIGGVVRHEPKSGDEFTVDVPDVLYRRIVI